jgi:hypothetical protein
MEPETHYAKSGGLRVAYQVMGEGPDLVMVPGLTSHLEIQWRDPGYRRFVRSLSSFCRLARVRQAGRVVSCRACCPDPAKYLKSGVLARARSGTVPDMDSITDDVVVVGGRCAGAPTAMLLARAGLSVRLLERSACLGDVVSGHMIKPAGVARLRRWKLLDAVLATGCPSSKTGCCGWVASRTARRRPSRASAR